jgi:hypothetical protein
LSHVQALDCQNNHGIAVVGNDNRVEQSKALRNAVFGIRVVGNENTVFSSQVDRSPWGIVFQGQENTVERSKVRRNTVVGIVFFGNDNIAAANRVEDGSDAFQGQGARNVFTRNVAVGNRECGLGLFLSSDSVVELNQARSNVWGLCIEGTGHTVSRNVVSGSVQSGIVTGRFLDPSVGGVFNGNRITNNGGFGIEETGGGGNTYTSNLCAGNDLGNSSPAGLCQ